MKLSEHFELPRPDTLEAYEYQSLHGFTEFSEDRLASFFHCGHPYCCKPASVIILHNPAGALPRCTKHMLASGGSSVAEMIVKTVAFTKDDGKLLDASNGIWGWKTWPYLKQLCRAAQILKEGSIIR